MWVIWAVAAYLGGQGLEKMSATLVIALKKF